MSDEHALLSLAATHPFATVISCAPDDATRPTVSHLPLLVDAEGRRLRGHLARENPHCSQFASGVDVLAIFHGPHAYVSPSIYAEQPSVPTWNYVVVHVRGRARLVDEQGLQQVLDDSVAHFDRTGWRLETDPAFLGPRLAAIAGFEIAIDELEGKWKVSQNRSPADRARVASWLDEGDEQSRALAAIVRALG
jgi:transcriptional regulator